MPNHVYNQLIFDQVHLEKIKELCFTRGSFDFEKLIPIPLYVYRGDLKRSNDPLVNIEYRDNWYSWQSNNWGTKWNAYDAEVSVVDGLAVVSFTTAWEPPVPVIIAFANLLKIKFAHRYWVEGDPKGYEDRWGISDEPRSSEHMSRLSRKEVDIP
jgi:hypothetical protein